MQSPKLLSCSVAEISPHELIDFCHIIYSLAITAVTVICVPPGNACPRTNYPRDIGSGNVGH